MSKARFTKEELREKHRIKEAERRRAYPERVHEEQVRSYNNHRKEIQQRDMRRYAKRKQAEKERQRKFFGDKCCVVCETTDNLCLHHVNPNTKKFASGQLWRRAQKVREEEIEKCVVLCNSCHMKLHNGDRHRSKKGQFVSTQTS